MRRIICNSVDFVFIDEIETMNPGSAPVLKNGKEWKKINVIENPNYRSSVKQNDAGPSNEETVSAKSRKNNVMELLIEYCGFHTVLRECAPMKKPSTLEISNIPVRWNTQAIKYSTIIRSKPLRRHKSPLTLQI